MCRRVDYQQKEILLKPKEFDILLCIAQRYPAIVSSEEISNTFSKAKNRLSDKKGQDIDCHEQFRCWSKRKASIDGFYENE